VMRQLQENQAALTSAPDRLPAVFEQYPDLSLINIFKLAPISAPWVCTRFARCVS